MRKQLLGICVTLVAAMTAVATPALSSTVQMSAPQSSQISPDVFGGFGYVQHYKQYLTYPLYFTQGYVNGGEISWHDYGGQAANDSSEWYALQKGTVSMTWPWATGTLGPEFYGHAVIKLQHFLSSDWNLGTSDDLHFAVLRPTTDGNYFVEYSLGGPNYWLINVHVSNNFKAPWCLTFGATDFQAQYSPCGLPGTTLSWQTLG